MGSRGTGNFTDYHGYNGGNPKQGGKSGENKCEQAFSAYLEDVETSQFYKEYSSLPSIRSEVIVKFNGSRIVAVLNEKEIGNLPTKFNYLIACLSEYNYSGIVSSTTVTPILTIKINVTPND